MSSPTHPATVDEAQRKEAEWIVLQQSLARRVEVPEAEYALLRSVGNDEATTQTPHVQSAFVHGDFALPWDGLKTMLACSGLIAETAEGGAELSVCSVPAPAAAGRDSVTAPSRSFRGWHTVAGHHSLDAQRWAAQVLHDVSTQTTALAQTSEAAPPSLSPLRPLEYIGGIDISFVPNTDIGVACLAVLHYPSLTLCHRYMHHCVLTEPYVSGFLAFREVEPVMALFAKVKGELEAAQRLPQLLFVDGCGVHHPRRCGLASHLGVLLGIPTIGCAKNLLVVGDVTRESVEASFTNLGVPASSPPSAPRKPARASAGDTASVPRVPPMLPLITTSPAFLSPPLGAVALYGYALQTSPSIKKCIFVSPGTRVGYAMAVALVLLVSQHRVPEPIRAADLGSREYIRATFAGTGAQATPSS